MKAIIGKMSLLALAAGLAGGAMMAGCSSSSDKTQTAESKGSVGFQLSVGAGATINTMHVAVYGNGLGTDGASTNIVKDLDVSSITGDSTAFTLVLPAGSNYQVRVTSPDNGTCLGTGTFNVTAGQTSTINVTMSCTAASNTGDTTVNVNACSAAITSVFIGPNSQVVGKNIVVDATATAGATFLWSRTGNGDFANAAAASTAFTCTSVGNPTLTLTVTGSTTSGGACTASKTFAVSCTAGANPGAGGAPGSGGAPAAGGAPGSGGTGTGGAPASGGTGSGGAPAAGGTGSGGAAAGGTPGTGGTPASGGAPGTGGALGTGGGAMTQMCPSPVNNVLGTQTCSADFTSNDCGTACAQISKPACLSCEVNSPDTVCYGSTADGSSVLDCNLVVSLSGPTTSTGASRFALCNQALECIRTSKCGQGNNLSCYCGTSGSNCTTAGSANGPCKTILEAALETTTPSDIFARFADPAYAGGLALIRADCDRVDCPVCYN